MMLGHLGKFASGLGQTSALRRMLVQPQLDPNQQQIPGPRGPFGEEEELAFNTGPAALFRPSGLRQLMTKIGIM